MRFEDIKVGGIYKFTWDFPTRRDEYMIFQIIEKDRNNLRYSIIKDYDSQTEWSNGRDGWIGYNVIEEVTEEELDKAMVYLI